MKRAASQWNVGRYLYHLDEIWAEVSEDRMDGRNWHYATVKTDDGKQTYWWQSPPLPGFALPKTDITKGELSELVIKWRAKFAPDVENKAERQEGFTRWVHMLIGESFPVGDFRCWTKQALEKCHAEILATDDPNGISASFPFETDKE